MKLVFSLDISSVDDVEDFLDRWSAFLVWSAMQGTVVRVTTRDTGYTEEFDHLTKFGNIYTTPNGLEIDPMKQIIEVFEK